jgi:hypothetical protein
MLYAFVSSLVYMVTDHEQQKAHAMTPFQGAGAGQAIEVSQPVPRAAPDRLNVVPPHPTIY